MRPEGTLDGTIPNADFQERPLQAACVVFNLLGELVSYVSLLSYFLSLVTQFMCLCFSTRGSPKDYLGDPKTQD